MKRLVWVCLLATGCDWYFGNQDPPPPDAGVLPIADAAVPFADAGLPNCLDMFQRMDCQYDLSGSVVDFTTQEAPALAGTQLEVELNTAWDVIPPFPAMCAALTTIPVDGMGSF